MYLKEANVLQVTKKQYFYKLRAHYGIFTSLLLTQLIALAFSFMGSGSSGTGTDGVMVNVTYYTGNTIIAFTMLWAFIGGVSMNSRLVRDGDFSFVTNRFTSHLSTIAFFLTASVIGGIMAMLGSSLLKVIVYFTRNDSMLNQTYSIPPLQLLIGIIATVLYVTLFGGLGYLIAEIVRVNRLLVILVPASFLGLLFIEGRTNGQGPLAEIFKFFALETSIFLLIVKVFVVVVIFFSTTIIMSNKIEVRR